MLILIRRVGETLMIGDGVTVTVGGVAGRRAVLDMARSGRSETEVVAIGGTLTVDDDVTVTVLDIRGRQVRLGVTAPKDVPVHREEIYVRIQNEKKEKDCA